jgi:two-component system response regulator
MNADGAILLVEGISSDEQRDGVEARDFLFGRDAHAHSDAGFLLPQRVLLDLERPKIDGLEGLRALRADRRMRRAPIVVLTSSVEEQEIARCTDGGANSHVPEPVDFDPFIEAVRQRGLHWRVLDARAPIVGKP